MNKKIIISITTIIIVLLSFIVPTFAETPQSNILVPVAIGNQNDSQAEYNYGIQNNEYIEWFVQRKTQGVLTSAFAYALNDATTPLFRGDFGMYTDIGTRFVLNFGHGSFRTGQVMVGEDWVGVTIQVVYTDNNYHINVYKNRSMTQYNQSLVSTVLQGNDINFDQYGMTLLDFYYTINVDTREFNLYLKTSDRTIPLFTWQLETIAVDRIRFGMYDAYDYIDQAPFAIEEFTFSYVTEGYSDGYKKGYEEGSRIGYNRGFGEGEDYGYRIGWDRGYEEGLRNGSAIGGDDLQIGTIFSGILDSLTNLWAEIFDVDLFGISLHGLVGSIIVVGFAIVIYGIIRKFVL